MVEANSVTPKNFREFAGYRACVERKVNGVSVVSSVVDGRESDICDTEDGRWATVCETHSTLVQHKSLKLAREWLGHSTGWCDECREIESSKPWCCGGNDQGTHHTMDCGDHPGEPLQR